MASAAVVEQVAGRRMQPRNQADQVGYGDEEPERPDERQQQCRTFRQDARNGRLDGLNDALQRGLDHARLFDGQAAGRQPAADTEHQQDAPGRHNRSGNAERSDTENDAERFHHQFFRMKT